MATGTIVSNGGSDITEYGFVWSLTTTPTLEDNVVVVGSENYVGEFSHNITSLPPDEEIYVRAYATNGVGTGYGDNINGLVMICLAAGTSIRMLSGSTKNIEDVKYGDDLLVWNFDDGCFDHADPVWMVKPFRSTSQAIVTFNNGSQLTTVNDGKGHRIYDVELGKFVHLMESSVGTKTFTENSELIEVIKKEIVKKETTFYNVITRKHFNLFANGILTSTGLNNIYPVKNMKFQKSSKQLRSLSDFAVSNELFEGLRLAEQPTDYPDLEAKLVRMLNRAM
jgi:hypothetical protein